MVVHARGNLCEHHGRDAHARAEPDFVLCCLEVGREGGRSDALPYADISGHFVKELVVVVSDCQCWANLVLLNEDIVKVVPLSV